MILRSSHVISNLPRHRFGQTASRCSRVVTRTVASQALDPPPWTLFRPELYKQRLPSLCTAWASQEGRSRFKEAVLAGTAECYFALSCHFDAQAEPATCGLGTLAMILNALGMRPPAPSSCGKHAVSTLSAKFWTERTLPLDKPWDVVLKQGTDIDEIFSLARSVGAHCEMVRAPPADVSIPGAPPGSSASFIAPPARASSCGNDPTSAASASSMASSAGSFVAAEDSAAGMARFRRVVAAASRRSSGVAVAMTFSRTALYQTGDGHFSPLGAYHAGSDSVLVLESAKFKYPPHWVPVPLMWKAMGGVDRVTMLPRGYLVVSVPGTQFDPDEESRHVLDGSNSEESRHVLDGSNAASATAAAAARTIA